MASRNKAETGAEPSCRPRDSRLLWSALMRDGTRFPGLLAMLFIAVALFLCVLPATASDRAYPVSEALPPPTPTTGLTDKANTRRQFWFQPKAWNDGLKQHGISGNISFTNDWSLLRSLRSSPPDSAERYLLDARLTLRTDQLLGWNGGTASVRLHHYFGDDGSERLGDAQGFSNIDDVPRNILYELWFQQTLLEGKVRMKFGKVDANTEFARVESAGNFLNSSMGYSPTILSLPTYPEPQPSANLFLRPGPYSFGLGLYRAGAGSAL